MIKTIATPQNNTLKLELPNNYIGKKIEIIIYALDEIEEKNVSPKNTMANLWGTLSDSTAQDMLKESEESRNTWEPRLNKQF